MLVVPPVRHLLRARDLADARYFEPLTVDDLARAAGLSRAQNTFDKFHDLLTKLQGFLGFVGNPKLKQEIRPAHHT